MLYVNYSSKKLGEKGKKKKKKERPGLCQIPTTLLK